MLRLHRAGHLQRRPREGIAEAPRRAQESDNRHEVDMDTTHGLGLGDSVRLATALALCAFLGGCVDIRNREYTPVTVSLDGRSELHISTYPSWFPSETSDIPFLKKTVRTPESVYFQVFVRDAKKKAGPNPHVDTILIESFSYRIAGRAPVVLLENYDRNFWMQNDPNANKGEPVPVPWVEGQPLPIAISLVLNGKTHEFKTDMQAVERKSTRSLLAHEFLR
jgi:hypothetical protein